MDLHIQHQVQNHQLYFFFQYRASNSQSYTCWTGAYSTELNSQLITSSKNRFLGQNHVYTTYQTQPRHHTSGLICRYSYVFDFSQTSYHILRSVSTVYSFLLHSIVFTILEIYYILLSVFLWLVDIQLYPVWAIMINVVKTVFVQIFGGHTFVFLMCIYLQVNLLSHRECLKICSTIYI